MLRRMLCANRILSLIVMDSECYGLLTPVRPVLTETADTAVANYAATTKPEQSEEADVQLRFRFFVRLPIFPGAGFAIQ